MKKTVSKSSIVPKRPRLVLRIGFAGRRDLVTCEEELLDAALDAVLATFGRRLAALDPGTPVELGKEPPVTAFYSCECPLLRVVTGLCEGADARAAEAITRVNVAPDATAACPTETCCLETELAAVLPFDVETYRASRPEPFRSAFDQQLSKCAWIITLDGIYDKPSPDTPLSQNRRARAYRAQSAVLLRQTDVLIAAANPDGKGGAGGTLETVRDALAFNIPVVFIHTGKSHVDEAVYLIEPEDLPPNVLARKAPSIEERSRRLTEWITRLTADPDYGLAPSAHHAAEVKKHGQNLLAEYFDDASSPQRSAAKSLSRLRKLTWKGFENRFKASSSVASDPKLPPYDKYRQRATELNYHYTGSYRGAFLLNYLLAISAVVLAALSLTILGTNGHTPLGAEIATILKRADHLPKHAPVNPAPPFLAGSCFILSGHYEAWPAYPHQSQHPDREPV